MNRDGKTNGIRFRISPEFGNNQYPAVAYNPALDQYLVVYEVPGAGIYGQIVNNTGSPVLPELDIVGSTGGTPRKPAVVYCSGSNQYLVIWQFDTGTTKGIEARIINGNGTISDIPLAVTGQLTIVEPGEPDVAYDSALDQALVVWQQWAGVSDISQRNIYGQIIALTGGARLEGPAIAIHESADDEMNPAVAGLPLSAGVGGYLVVCQRWYGVSSMIDGRTVNSGGGGLGSWVGISPFTGFVPAVAANENTREYLVAWAADNQTLQARTVSADGLHLSSYGQLSGLFLSHPAIAGGPLGDYLVTFDDLFTSGYTYDIFGWLWGNRVFLPAVLKN
jgi:hypothetical protein